MTPHTYLFVPGDRPERFDKALAAGADAMIVDLEDAVAPERKAQARSHAVAWAREHRDALDRVLVRVNAAGTEWFGADLSALRDAGIRTVMLSKAESRAHVEAVRTVAPATAVVALIESAQGVAALEDICATPGMQRLAFGTLDYALDLGLTDDDRGLLYAASRMAIASRCAGLAPPIAGVTPSIDDAERIRADLAFARALGFGAKLCIHPKQVAIVREALRPTDAEADWARRVLEAAASGAGAVKVDGRMVDRPVVLKAQDILSRAQR